MLRLKKLTIANLGRFVKEHTIVFDGREHLIQVDAVNKNTGGSSGSGKSTIFNALEYLLGINQLPTTVLQSRLTKEAMSTIGEFELDGKSLVISRSKSSGLSISLNGTEIVSGNNKAAEEKLDEILGIPRDLLRKMIHKRQKEGGFFLNLTPKESHAFLVEALDLKLWESRLEQADLDAKRISTDLNNVTSLINSTSHSLLSTQQSFDGIQKPFIDFEPTVIDILSATVQRYTAQEQEILQKMQTELSSIARPLPPVLDQDKLILESLELELKQTKANEAFEKNQLLKTLENLTISLQQKEQSVLSIKKSIEIGKRSALELEHIKKKIQTIQQGICPTCNQQWHQGQAEIETLVVAAKKNVLDIQQAESLQKELEPLLLLIGTDKYEIENVKSKMSNKSSFADTILNLEISIKTESERLQKERDLINQAYRDALNASYEKESQIKNNFEQELSQIRFSIQEASNILIQKKAQLVAYRQAQELYVKNSQSLSDSIESLSKQIKDLEIKKVKLEEDLLVSLDAIVVIKSYTNTLFQGALDNIATKATEILSKIPNMSTASIYFEGFKETKSGTIKEEVSAIITMDEEINIPVKSMSGGERTAIDLAVDLAVIDMIEEQAGKGLDIFVLDEPFDGLDSACREQCLEILKTHVSDKKIIVVDHSNETKEMVSDRILVVRDGQESYIGDSYN